ncbi:hypothetical protein IM538_14960 [Cytobacillus suaedae]|nr:hypothetical protein IM538_14960 [Cytobacillus suaedae]
MFIESGNYEVLLAYTFRQVVINEKEDDMLINRLGFFFDTIEINPNRVSFMKNDNPVYYIQLKGFLHFKQRVDFPNFFEVTYKNYSIEIYFP